MVGTIKVSGTIYKHLKKLICMKLFVLLNIHNTLVQWPATFFGCGSERPGLGQGWTTAATSPCSTTGSPATAKESDCCRSTLPPNTTKAP